MGGISPRKDSSAFSQLPSTNMDDDQATVEAVLTETAPFDSTRRTAKGSSSPSIRNLIVSRRTRKNISQETFPAAYRSPRTCRSARPSSPPGQLTIARNECLLGAQPVVPLRPPIETAPDPLSPAAGPVERLDEGRALGGPRRGPLELLPLEQRTAFILAEIQQLPHAEVAVIEAVEIGTIKSASAARRTAPESAPGVSTGTGPPPTTSSNSAPTPSRLRSEIPHDS